MNKTLLALLGAATIIAPGCAIPRDQDTGRATTNTLPIKSEEIVYTFLESKLDTLKATHKNGDRHYALPRDLGFAVHVNGKPVNEANVLDEKLSAEFHSDRVRTPTSHDVTPVDGGTFYLVNAFVKGNVVFLNHDQDPREMRSILEKKRFPRVVNYGDLGARADELYAEIAKRNSGLKIGDTEVVSIAAQNPFQADGPHRAFLEVKRDESGKRVSPNVVYKISTRNGVVTEVTYGIEGVTYFPVEGQEVELPKGPQLKNPRVIEYAEPAAKKRI